MTNWDDLVLSRLFLAVPELQIDEALMRRFVRAGLVNEEAVEIARSLRRRHTNILKTSRRMRNQTLLTRIALVAPELMSLRMVDFLRTYNLVDVKTANLLRVAFRAQKALLPSAVSEKTIWERFLGLSNATLSQDMINYFRDVDDARLSRLRNALLNLRPGERRSRLTSEDAAYLRDLLEQSVRRAQIFRSVLKAGKLSSETYQKAALMDGMWATLTVVLEGMLSEAMLKQAVRSGAISHEMYNKILVLSRLGLKLWRVTLTASNYDSMVARGLMLSEGFLSYEMVQALYKNGLISKRLYRLLNPTATIIRHVTRGQLAAYMKGARVRPIPGESPLATYARVTKVTDDYLLRLLAEASSDARKAAEALAAQDKFGHMTKSSQQRLVVKTLHAQMRDMYETVGHLTIFGEKEAAAAADEAMEFLQNKAWRGASKEALDQRRMIARQAAAGVDSFVSRSENLHPLSDRIYKNWFQSRAHINREVSKALLRGLNARDFARAVSSTINPGVPGGISYNATRLARTEINNAFHFTSIRYTREMPWVEGYKWNLSGSHPKLDICNEYADKNHDDIGRGVFKKGNVPGKPHPHCFCFITTVTADASTFEKRLRSGAYDRYMTRVADEGVFSETDSFASVYTGQLKGFAANAAGAAAATYAYGLIGESASISKALRAITGVG